MTTTENSRADALTAMADDMRAEQTYLGSSRESCDNSGRIRWDRLQRVIDHLAASPVDQPAAAPIVRVNRHAVMRLKSICRKLGIESAVPEEVFVDPDGLFAIFGQIRSAIDRLARPAPSPADERAARAEAALRALVEECENDAIAGWEERMRRRIDDANRVLARAASANEAGAEGADLERALSETIDERDRFEEDGTRLANAVGEFLGVDVGEWSSANDPILAAIEALESRSPAMEAKAESLEAAWNEKSGRENWGHEPTAKGLFEDGWRAAFSAIASKTWRIVPSEPTMEMLVASRAADREYQQRMGLPDYIGVGGYDHYIAMLAAAPQPAQADARVGLMQDDRDLLIHVLPEHFGIDRAEQMIEVLADHLGQPEPRAEVTEEQPSLTNPLTPYGMLVRALRIVSGTTLMDMAQHLGRGPAELSAVEFGRNPVRDADIVDAAHFFACAGIQSTTHALTIAARTGASS
ncbi:hypothetical protein [Burkholderia cepacia]|uniref:hypothetical protein n=1 Tax=Burkholderia cepacia TaxID=292 RepID=UPI0029907491|nr:hypothetical protein [Burkholderia cepacia]MDW9243940.1 hypothetical protein [Burkholderia cepacia]